MLKYIINYIHCVLYLAATAVAWELYQIFTTQGCPLILQSDNGKEFVNKVIKKLKTLWPECILVRGRPRQPKTQGSVETANQDVHPMVTYVYFIY